MYPLYLCDVIQHQISSLFVARHVDMRTDKMQLFVRVIKACSKYFITDQDNTFLSVRDKIRMAVEVLYLQYC